MCFWWIAYNFATYKINWPWLTCVTLPCFQKYTTIFKVTLLFSPRMRNAFDIDHYPKMNRIDIKWIILLFYILWRNLESWTCIILKINNDFQFLTSLNFRHTQYVVHFTFPIVCVDKSALNNSQNRVAIATTL